MGEGKEGIESIFMSGGGVTFCWSLEGGNYVAKRLDEFLILERFVT